jgi:hypothetical protein
VSTLLNIDVVNGIFNVILGTGTAEGIPVSVFNGKYNKRVTMQFDVDTKSERQKIVSVGYAYIAEIVSDNSITSVQLSPDNTNNILEKISAGLIDIENGAPRVYPPMFYSVKQYMGDCRTRGTHFIVFWGGIPVSYIHPDTSGWFSGNRDK